MPEDIPEIEPTEIEAGTTVKWKKDLSDHYPADDGWSLAYTFINGSAKFTVNATAEGKKFSVTIPASTTANYVAGRYEWIARVSKGSEAFTPDKGHCDVLKDLAAAGLTVFDHRTHVKKTLDAIEAVIEGRATSDHLSYTIAGRSITKMSVEELLKLRDRYKAEYQREVDAERIANGEGLGRKVLTRFA